MRLPYIRPRNFLIVILTIYLLIGIMYVAFYFLYWVPNVSEPIDGIVDSIDQFGQDLRSMSEAFDKTQEDASEIESILESLDNISAINDDIDATFDSIDDNLELLSQSVDDLSESRR